MMQPETVIKVYRAAEDWVQGLTRKEILAKYNITPPTYYRWKRSEAWTHAVGDRERQERQPAVRYDRYNNLPYLKSLATRWVASGKPPLHEYAATLGIKLEELEDWASTPFWESAVLYTEHHRERRKKRKSKRFRFKAGRKFPHHLLKQAVFLYLAGWPNERIGPVIGRSPRTIETWKDTDAWDAMVDELMIDKLYMHVLDIGVTIQEGMQRIMDSQWRS